MRLWGYWTKGKLDILRRYLDAFTTTTKHKASERIYIDAFAGEPENRDRLTAELIEGSARIALSITDPPFTRLRFFETETFAGRLETSLRRDFPDRDIKVLGGDCNELIPQELDRLRALDWAPTFAFVDPNGMEAEWQTLEALAHFKHRRRWKVEIFLLFSPRMLVRLLPVQGGAVDPAHTAKIDRLFGTQDWRQIYGARLQQLIEPGQALQEYLNLMRWRLEEILGYEWTHPIEIRNERGDTIYYMVFATDHPVGDEIMRDVYAKAAEEFPKMREEARRFRKQQEDKQHGVPSLFGADDQELWGPIQPGERFYEHEPPTEPWFLDP
ncbi:MAG: three-Cys-motif partner protein TcmP, partial [Acidimicrobiia bacterium]|nr:three-Cys-motif partner protein TcmP [Acidimicrobiia bacterium]